MAEIHIDRGLSHEEDEHRNLTLLVPRLWPIWSSYFCVTGKASLAILVSYNNQCRRFASSTCFAICDQSSWAVSIAAEANERSVSASDNSHWQ